MRSTRLAVLAAIPVALATLGCDSTQPDQVTTAAATLTVTAQAKVDDNDCWNVWVDTDDNGLPDEDTGVIMCQPIQKEIRSVPWRYSIQVSLLKSGQTAAQVIASSVEPGDSVPDFVSLTPYDQTPLSIGANRLPEPPLYFLNSTRCSNGSQYWLSANGYDFGPSNVVEEIPSYSFTMELGDTVLVQAVKQAEGDAPPFLPTDQPVELHIAGQLTINGVQVQLLGQPISPDSDLGGISFSYTRR